MRRYVVEIWTTVRVVDEESYVIAQRSSDRSVAVDIRGQERDQIIKDVTTEVAEDMAHEMPVFVKKTFQSTKDK